MVDMMLDVVASSENHNSDMMVDWEMERPYFVAALNIHLKIWPSHNRIVGNWAVVLVAEVVERHGFQTDRVIHADFDNHSWCFGFYAHGIVHGMAMVSVCLDDSLADILD